jgi:ketosteroid isomerase-like protein
MSSEDELSGLLERCRADHHSWINGDATAYALPDDGSIFGAVGGFSPGGAETAQRQRMVAAQWRRGTGSIEFVNGGTHGDLAWLVFIERGTVEFADEAESVEHRWDLRVTEIFRRCDGEWQRLHRHADPLVDRHRLVDVAALLT